jgi:hypothetical protein
MRGNGRVLGNPVGAVSLAQARAHVAVDLVVEGLGVAPEPFDVGFEIGGRHVVAGAPEGTHVVEADLARSLIAELGIAGELLFEGRRDGVPARPRLE